MLRPTVRMILHPPSAVPTVSATAQPSVAQAGAASVSIRPSASSSAAITPIDFCASFAPWLNASAADIAHSPARTGACQRRVRASREPAKRPDREQRRPRSEQRRDRQRDERADDAHRVPAVEPAPVDRVRPRPPTSARTHETADERVAGARRQAEPPRDEIPGHRGRETGPDHLGGGRRRDGHDAADRVGHRGADERTGRPG